MPAISGWLHLSAASLTIAASTYGAIPARATDVIAEWSTIQIPPPPALKPVTVDPKSTALFLFDFMTENCGQRPRCVAAVPTVKALHDRARAASVLVAYTLPDHIAAGYSNPLDGHGWSTARFENANK